MADLQEFDGGSPQEVATEQKQRALREALHELLGGESGASFASLPSPVINIIADYNTIVIWKLVTSAPVFGAIERLSDYSARYTRGSYTPFIQGDTPLSSGVHAWRVKIEGLDANGWTAILGIVEAGKQLGVGSYKDPSFYGVCTESNGVCYKAGQCSYDSGLGEIGNGDTLDFLLNVDAGSLTGITLKDDKRCDFALPTDIAWVPHFYLWRVGNSFSVEVIRPEEAGKKG